MALVWFCVGHVGFYVVFLKGFFLVFHKGFPYVTDFYLIKAEAPEKVDLDKFNDVNDKGAYTHLSHYCG